jgi:hypothetical protein
MKRISPYIITSVIILFVNIFGITQGFAEDKPEREWLILVYASAVNDHGLSGYAKDLINQLEKVGSSDKTTIILKYTALEAGKNKELLFPKNTTTLLIKGDKGNPEITSSVIESSLPTDMASEFSLSLFVRKNMMKYPSKKTMVVLWGKGEGLKGALHDDLSQRRMTVPGMAKALSKVRKETNRKIDILVLDADLMQMAECIYELKDEARIIVGSSESAPSSHYIYDLALQEAIDDPTKSAKTISGAMVYFAEDPVTSAVATDKVDGFVKLLDQWADVLMNDEIALKHAAAAIDKTFSFAMTDSKDLCDFIDQVEKSLSPDSSAAIKGRELKKYILRELVISTHWMLDAKKLNGKPYGERSHGLAIYLPELTYDSQTYEPLGFAAHTQWPALLLKLSEQQLKK